MTSLSRDSSSQTVTCHIGGFGTPDQETGLYYYGYRHYSPTLARWISKDPVEEQGGLNLYVWCQNDGLNRWDLLGYVSPWGVSTNRLGVPSDHDPEQYGSTIAEWTGDFDIGTCAASEMSYINIVVEPSLKIEWWAEDSSYHPIHNPSFTFTAESHELHHVEIWKRNWSNAKLAVEALSPEVCICECLAICKLLRLRYAFMKSFVTALMENVAYDMVSYNHPDNEKNLQNAQALDDLYLRALIEGEKLPGGVCYGIPPF